MPNLNDYRSLPPGKPNELLQGELVECPPHLSTHQAVTLNLLHVIDTWRQLSEGGGQAITFPFEVVLADDTVVLPDLIFLSPARISALFHGQLQGPPTVIAEVHSDKKECARDTGIKRKLYERHKVAEYWMIDLVKRAVTILSYDREFSRFTTVGTVSGDDELASRALEGLSLRASDVFRGV